MRPAEVRAALAQLGLSQGEAARLLGVRLRTMQRWVSGRPPMAEPAAQALRAWCRLAERGLAWRTNGLSIELEDLRTLAGARRQALEAILRRVAMRGWPKRRWRINVVRRRAATQGIVVNFNLLSDGSYVPASYRRLDGPSDVDRDRAIIEESIAAFADAAAKFAGHRSRDRFSANTPPPTARGVRS